MVLYPSNTGTMMLKPIPVGKCVCVYAYVRTYTYVCMYVFIYLCMYVCLYACM
jgi:acyl-CoA hydrolase